MKQGHLYKANNQNIISIRINTLEGTKEKNSFSLKDMYEKKKTQEIQISDISQDDSYKVEMKQLVIKKDVKLNRRGTFGRIGFRD